MKTYLIFLVLSETRHITYTIPARNVIAALRLVCKGTAYEYNLVAAIELST